MNKLVIPSSPNWYEPDILACSPDNTLVYGSRQDLIVIKPTSETEPDNVQVITRAHSTRIKSVNINRNWGEPHKYAVTVSEDSIVKLWDISTLKKVASHNKHASLNDSSKLVGASFAGDDRVISVTEGGKIVIWNIPKNETNVTDDLFDNKVTVTCLSLCPHATWLAGFGLKNGLIIVADLRRMGKVVHKLRGHNKAVVSLSWCPAPVNIFPYNPNNKVVEKGNKDNQEPIIEEKVNEENSHEKMQDIEEIGEEDCVDKSGRRKQKNPKKAPNPWLGLIHADDGPAEQPETKEEHNDFLKECRELRTQILHTSHKVTSKEQTSVNSQDSTEMSAPRTILKPKSKRSTLSDLLQKKQLSLNASEVKEKNDELLKENDVTTPTDRREMDMEISNSMEKKLEIKLTDHSVKSMEMTMCVGGRTDSQTEMYFSDCVDSSPLNITSSSDESKKFSSASSCDNDLNCSKRKKESLELEEVSLNESCEVFSDNWRTEKPTFAEEEPRKEYLLASSGRDTNIFIWRAGTDGRMQTFLTLPSVKSKKSNARTDKIWNPICWVAPNILLSSSRYAELLQWTLPKPLDQSKSVRLVHRDHWCALFSIKAPIFYSNEFNFLQKRSINVWTTGMDRHIMNTDLATLRNEACYPALGGTVNCLSGSPLDPNRVACGTGEGVVNLWDLSRDHRKKILFSTFYQKIMSSVTALAWHPLIETSLAFATTEGRVGILDTSSKSKSPKILPPFFKSQVFKIEWGPLNSDTQNLGVYVVAESKIAIFDPKSQEKEPKMLELPENTQVYTMSWKPDYSLLLVSSKSGTLITYTKDLNVSNVSYVTMKLQSIVWNPDASSSDASLSKYCNTFASIVKSVDLVVYDLGVQSDHNEDKIIARFENRGVVINSVQWNPHTASQLVFVDNEGVAQVYDVETKSVLSTYVSAYLDPLLSVYWSPLDQDYVISGTLSHKIIVWRVSENCALSDKQIISRRNKLVKAQPKEATELAPAKHNEACKKSTKSQILPLFYAVKETSQVQDIRKLLKWKLGDKSVEATAGDNRHIDVLDVFDDGNKMEKVLDLNVSMFRQQGKHRNGDVLALFKGELDGAIKEAIDQKRVTPWIISMCPMVSPKLWQNACETYANQLLEEADADPSEIVTYLLACHRVEEAVDVLCEKEMFREALALAKARFGVDNTVVPGLLDKWAKRMIYQGNFEVAAQCYISLGKYGDAASVLYRRSSVDLLQLAVELAELSGNEELHKAILFRLQAFKIDTSETKDDQQHQKNASKDETNESHVNCDNTTVRSVASQTDDISEDDSGAEPSETPQKLEEIVQNEDVVSGADSEERRNKTSDHPTEASKTDEDNVSEEVNSLETSLIQRNEENVSNGEENEDRNTTESSEGSIRSVASQTDDINEDDSGAEPSETPQKLEEIVQNKDVVSGADSEERKNKTIDHPTESSEASRTDEDNVSEEVNSLETSLIQRNEENVSNGEENENRNTTESSEGSKTDKNKGGEEVEVNKTVSDEEENQMKNENVDEVCGTSSEASELEKIDDVDKVNKTSEAPKSSEELVSCEMPKTKDKMEETVHTEVAVYCKFPKPCDVIPDNEDLKESRTSESTNKNEEIESKEDENKAENQNTESTTTDQNRVEDRAEDNVTKDSEPLNGSEKREDNDVSKSSEATHSFSEVSKQIEDGVRMCIVSEVSGTYCGISRTNRDPVDIDVQETLSSIIYQVSPDGKISEMPRTSVKNKGTMSEDIQAVSATSEAQVSKLDEDKDEFEGAGRETSQVCRISSKDDAKATDDSQTNESLDVSQRSEVSESDKDLDQVGESSEKPKSDEDDEDPSKIDEKKRSTSHYSTKKRRNRKHRK